MTRPTKFETYMKVAETVALRSHDSETKVGSVLVKKDSGAIIATGCNGFVRSAPDAILPNTRPDKYKYIVHSEMNLIYNAARHGISMEDTFVVCTLTPCVACMRGLWNTGVREVIAKAPYRDFQDILMMNDLNVTETRTDEGFIKLVYY